ncbi:MAG: hypothetical protein D6815_08010 [Candidatus Dadabacteria bacterium]|nr:MAG: hypothetical protein D6815_08010 [Candidatus Dadabacteria bacterium]
MLFSLMGMLLALAATRTALTALSRASSAAGQAERIERALTAARNLLEAQRALPCGPLPPCPRGFSCSVERSLLGRARDGSLLLGIEATVGSERQGPGPPVRLVTAARRTGTCSEAQPQ